MSWITDGHTYSYRTGASPTSGRHHLRSTRPTGVGEGAEVGDRLRQADADVPDSSDPRGTAMWTPSSWSQVGRRHVGCGRGFWRRRPRPTLRGSCLRVHHQASRWSTCRDGRRRMHAQSECTLMFLEMSMSSCRRRVNKKERNTCAGNL